MKTGSSSSESIAAVETLPAPLSIDEADEPPRRDFETALPPPRVGLALGSGSARGWAHVGVIRALLDHGIVPDVVAGCSMGAMIGAAFAAGRIDQLEAWALSLDGKGVFGLLDLGFRGGLIKGDRLLDFFHVQIVGCHFSELALPFAAVATDLTSGEEVWLRDGRVSEAVRASCAVPGLFQPVLRDGRYLIDGSVVNPIPVSLCRAMGADVVIAVDLGSDRPRLFRQSEKIAAAGSSYRQRMRNVLARRRARDGAPTDLAAIPLPSLANTLLGAVDIMQEGIARRRLVEEPPDVLLTPRLEPFGPFEYHRAALAIAEGRDAVLSVLPAIREAVTASAV